MKQSIKWQAWESEESITFAPIERIASMRSIGQLAGNAVFLHEIIAATAEDAMAKHHIQMGWEPYRPQGEPKPCPNKCGGDYYPLGYRDCPNCGHLG